MPKQSPSTEPYQPRLLRTAEAARYLGVGTKRIRQLIAEGKLKYIQLNKGDNSPFLIDRLDLDQFIQNNKR